MFLYTLWLFIKLVFKAVVFQNWVEPFLEALSLHVSYWNECLFRTHLDWVRWHSQIMNYHVMKLSSRIYQILQVLNLLHLAIAYPIRLAINFWNNQVHFHRLRRRLWHFWSTYHPWIHLQLIVLILTLAFLNIIFFHVYIIPSMLKVLSNLCNFYLSKLLIWN